MVAASCAGCCMAVIVFFFSSRRRHTRCYRDWSSDVCSSDLPLLEDISIKGAKGVLINITGNSSMTMLEVEEAATLIKDEAHEDANIIYGQVIDDSIGDEIRVTVIATGFGKSDEDAGHIIPSISLMKKESMDTPTFLRRDRSSENLPVIKIGAVSDFEMEDEYDVPTFMRRTAD